MQDAARSRATKEKGSRGKAKYEKSRSGLPVHRGPDPRRARTSPDENVRFSPKSRSDDQVT